MKQTFICCTILLLISFTTFSYSEPEIQESNVYYNIQGNTLEQLMNEMHHKGGRTVGAAWTDWQIFWDPETAKTEEGYIVTKSNTKLVLKYKYPKWTDEANGPKELRDKWANYCKNVVIHEEGHGAIAKEAAIEVDKAILSLKPEKNIRSLYGRVDAAAMKVINIYRNKGNTYDKDTYFGRKQGATF